MNCSLPFIISSCILASALFSGLSQAQPAENDVVWRAQVELRIANVRDADTNDYVQVRLNNSNVTRLDYGRNDFERGDRFTYDLVLDHIRTFSDIAMLKISKRGNDGLCLKRITLIINGRSIFARNFGNCRWLDNSSGYRRTVTFTGSTLRSKSTWKNYRQTLPPLSISRAELESRIEAIVGHVNAEVGNKLSWGHLHGRAVEVTRKDNTAIHVDLDLVYKVVGPNPEVDVDFDLRFSCRNGVISAVVENTKASVKILRIIKRDIEKSIPFMVNVNTGQSLCPQIRIQKDGSVAFSLPLNAHTQLRVRR